MLVKSFDHLSISSNYTHTFKLHKDLSSSLLINAANWLDNWVTKSYRRLTVDWTENNRRRLSSSIISCNSSWSVRFFCDGAGNRDEMLIGIKKPHPSESCPSNTARWITRTSVSVSQTSWRISSLQAVPFFNSILTSLYDKMWVYYNIGYKQRPYTYT